MVCVLHIPAGVANVKSLGVAASLDLLHVVDASGIVSVLC
jgi:hypothetical protein